MASAAQIAANRANAEKSTGPRTEEGKARSARNALKHGLLAERLLLDGEDPEAWEALRADYFARLQPHGEAEARLVDRIAQLAFRRERGSVAEAAAWRGYSRGGWIVDRKDRGKHRWDEDRDPVVAERATPIMNGVMAELLRVTAYEGRLSRELDRRMAELEALQRRRRADGGYEAERLDPPEAEVPPEDVAAAVAAGGGFLAPLAQPPADASLASWRAWTRVEHARLAAQAQALRAAQESQDKSAA
jgi:hypothetical protein